MKLIYGYEMNASAGQIGHVVCPPLLSTKITLSSAGNTNRWVFYGTRKQILDWMREHGDISLENSIFAGGKTCDNNVHTEIVVDVQYVYDQEQTYVNYIKSYFVDIYDSERVKVEIRPRVDSKDSVIPSLSRSIVASGTKLADLVDDLQAEWFKPGQSYAQQTVHLFSDTPTPNHILGAKPPTSIQVSTDAAQQSPAAVEADLDTPTTVNATAAVH
ncbi:hypothetical protein MAM1_0005d00553 [Mucor ambiguus]|uniref:Uncharacterized protein n=1 Tax=Mucor ambiguus TaxID=91626 RepID=A0A0C9MDQ2_9FUNG|nr:hypothetical protein MAM1_0005d00553 [Mucor ambiguus]